MKNVVFQRAILDILSDLSSAIQEVHDECYSATGGGPDWMRGSNPISITQLKSVEEQIDKLTKVMDEEGKGCKHDHIVTDGHPYLGKCYDCGKLVEV